MILHLFYKYRLPDKLPLSLQSTVDELKEASNKEECLRLAYNVLVKKYRGYRFLTYLRFWEVFTHDIDKIWSRSGFIHCTSMNYLLRLLLVKSGWFKDEEIEVKHSLIWYISIHQYSRARINPNKCVNVDIWFNSYGVGFGDYAHGFHA